MYEFNCSTVGENGEGEAKNDHAGTEGAVAIPGCHDAQTAAEEWRPVRGQEGKYEISNFGRLKRLNVVKRIATRNYRFAEDIIPLPFAGHYFRLTMRKDGKKRRYIHRMVAEAFIPNPEGKPEVNHKNGIKTDNHAENLEWCTHQENISHAHRTGLGNPPRGEMSPSCKLTESKVREIRSRYATGGCSHRGLASEYGVEKKTITSLLNRHHWRHVV